MPCLFWLMKKTIMRRIKLGSKATDGQDPKGTSLISLLANTKTSGCRKILKKYGVADATSIPDLEDKLVMLYRQSNDQPALELEFAQIHPHRSFILKNLAPKATEEAPTMPKSQIDDMHRQFIGEAAFSNCSGGQCSCDSCSQKRFSNACGCSSSLDGQSPPPYSMYEYNKMDRTETSVMLVLGGLTLLAMTGLFITHMQVISKR